MNTVTQVDPAKLVPHPANAHLFGCDMDQHLQDDIVEHGLQNPIQILPPGRPFRDCSGNVLAPYTIISGHRRARHAVAAGITSVDVLVRDDLVGASPEKIEYILIADNDPKLRRKITHSQSIAVGQRALELLKKLKAEAASGSPTAAAALPDGRLDEAAAKSTGISRKSLARGSEALAIAAEVEELMPGAKEQIAQEMDAYGPTAALQTAKAMRNRVVGKETTNGATFKADAAVFEPLRKAMKQASLRFFQTQAQAGGECETSKMIARNIEATNILIATWEKEVT